MNSQAVKAPLLALNPWPAQVRRGAAKLADIIIRVRQAARERRQLLALSDRDLHDIGISRIDALQEAEKPLWREVFVSHRPWKGGSP